MLVVVPFYDRDAGLTQKNLNHWIALDGHSEYPCLLVYDKETPPASIDAIRLLAKKYFSSVMEFNCGRPLSRQWPKASNYVFHQTIWYLCGISKANAIARQHWLWVESDSVAMKPGWLKAINAAHITGKKPFTGHWNFETQVWNGVSVYPPAMDVQRLTHNMMLCENNPWDVVASKQDNIQKHLKIANDLFLHRWADPATNAPYSFRNIAQVKALIPESVVLFHRCKDGSLIDVLTKEMRVAAHEKKVEAVTPKPAPVAVEVKAEAPKLVVQKSVKTDTLVVVPFCNKDANLAELNLKLCLKLDVKVGYTALLSYDDQTTPDTVDTISQLASQYFGRIHHFCYTAPIKTEWPRPQNHAWSKTAAYVEKHWNGGWFWWEMDAVPLKTAWLDALILEYVACGKPFMGYVVEQMGHMNGVAFYPAKLSRYVKNYGALNKAFDVAIRDKTIEHTHKVNHLMQNLWAFDAQGNHTLGLGKAPSFATKEDMERWVDFSKALFHRCKDGTLHQLLLAKTS